MVRAVKGASTFCNVKVKSAFNKPAHSHVLQMFIAWTIPDVGHLYQPLEDCIRHHFIPSVTGCPSPGDLV